MAKLQNSMKPIYLDYNATTPIDNKVLERMLPYFTEKFGNASSSTHYHGWQGKSAVEIALNEVSNFLKVDNSELIFTSGSTESINLAIKGVFEKYQSKGKHFICSKLEHKATLDTFSYIEKKGAEVTYLNADKNGKISLSELESSLRPDTVLVSIMLANNETGIISDLKKPSELIHSNKSIFMSDITQAVGKIEFDINDLAIDLAPISAHKFYGPKGIGALYVRRRDPRVALQEQINGGGHQKGRRSGTLNVPGIVGFSEAIKIIDYHQASFMREIRDFFEDQMKRNFEVEIIGEDQNRLPNTSMICFKEVKAERLISKCPKLSLSMGSACTSSYQEPSHVLKAMGLKENLIEGAIRFSFGRNNQMEEVKEIIKELKQGIDQII